MLPRTFGATRRSRFSIRAASQACSSERLPNASTRDWRSKFPNRQKRMNHIFKNQVFGLAITELTALLSRRSVYCSKTANGKYSVCEAFDNPEGNIRFGRVEHTWEDGRCAVLRGQQGELRKGRRTGKPRLRLSFTPTSRRRSST